MRGMRGWYYMAVQEPQSAVHVEQFSPALKSQRKLPHTLSHVSPQRICTSQTHVASQPDTQQKESTLQM